MAHLGQIESLVHLTVEGKQITDDGLVHLDELPLLQYLDARSTGITDQAFDSFLRRRPEVYVRTDRPRRTD
jgi:hypothetical protein